MPTEYCSESFQEMLRARNFQTAKVFNKSFKMAAEKKKKCD